MKTYLFQSFGDASVVFVVVFHLLSLYKPYFSSGSEFLRIKIDIPKVCLSYIKILLPLAKYVCLFPFQNTDSQ